MKRTRDNGSSSTTQQHSVGSDAHDDNNSSSEDEEVVVQLQPKAARAQSSNTDVPAECIDLVEKVRVALEDLERDGYAVVKQVFPHAECIQYIDSVWRWLASLNTGVKRDDRTTWYDAKRWPVASHGIMQKQKVGHQQFVWAVRTHPRVMWLFTLLWRQYGNYEVKNGPADMLCSMDGINLTLPPERAPTNRTPSSKSWLHTDQGRRLSDEHPDRAVCFQGFVNMEDATDQRDANLLVLRGSHQLHRNFMHHFDIQKKMGNWVKCEPQQEQWLRGQLKPGDEVRVLCERGDVVLWDSRTFHQAAHIVASQAKPRVVPDRFRHVVYVCMQPRTMATDADLAAKQKAFTGLQMTSHWAAHPIKQFSPNWQTWGAEPTEYTIGEGLIDPETASPLIRKLVGF